MEKGLITRYLAGYIAEMNGSEYVSKRVRALLHRYLAWDYCYNAFSEAMVRGKNNGEKEINLLALNLYAYLGTYGMLRGSSALLQKNYKVCISVARELINSDNRELCGNDFCESSFNFDRYWMRIFTLKYRLDFLLKGLTGRKPSDALLSKIMMGALGCVPAFDKYVLRGMRWLGFTNVCFDEKTIRALVKFYAENEELRQVLPKVNGMDVPYPPMKRVDMFFWMIGKEIEEKKR
ncbi:MAG: hypothetical protein PHP03_01680 [Candidatus Pacebacteria bacterium]|nr:hypothetical protein [Candidatus Paceibacterota bacterium]